MINHEKKGRGHSCSDAHQFTKRRKEWPVCVKGSILIFICVDITLRFSKNRGYHGVEMTEIED